MPIILSSTTDSSEAVQAAIEHYGNSVDSVETIATSAETVATPEATPEAKPEETTPEETTAPPEPVEETTEADGKTADESETPEDKQEPKEQERDPETGKFKAKTPGKGVQKRIDDLTREKYEERKAREEAETRLANLERELAELKEAAAKPKDAKAEEKVEPKPETKPVEPAPKPKLEDFPSYEDWVEAVIDWKSEQKVAKAEAKVQELRDELKRQEEAREAAAKEAAARQPILDAWDKKVETAKARYSDYDEVSATADKMEVPPVMQAAILESDLGADVAYWLCKHPEEFTRISKLQPVSAVREIGRLEATIAADLKAAEAPTTKPAPETPKPKPSTAPPPIKPVGTKSAAPAAKDPGQMTPQEYYEWRKAHPRG